MYSYSIKKYLISVLTNGIQYVYGRVVKTEAAQISVDLDDETLARAMRVSGILGIEDLSVLLRLAVENKLSEVEDRARENGAESLLTDEE